MLVVSYFGLYAQAWVGEYVELIFSASESDVFASSTKAGRLKRKPTCFLLCVYLKYLLFNHSDDRFPYKALHLLMRLYRQNRG